MKKDRAKIDELHLLTETTVRRSVSYEEFFSEMELSEPEKKKRISLAEKFEEDFIIFLIWMSDLLDKETTDYRSIKKRFADIWHGTASEHLSDEKFLKEYADQFAENAVESTLSHVSDDWYFSEDRAVFNAENEALTIYNREEYLTAIELGKSKKTWHSLLDGRERNTHRVADGQTIGIYDNFDVGSAKMFFPRDVSNLGTGADHPEEVVGCRCWCTYT